MKRIDQLTFTRFLAIFLVLYYHYGGGIYSAWIHSASILALLHAAPTAVSYLYVLSGFVMTIVYFRPEKQFDVRAYWTARFVRIYPLYIISFLLVCYFYLDQMWRIKPLKILTNVFVLQAWWPPYAQSFNYASWSMTVEFFFYAVFPFFTIWAYKQTTRRLIGASLILWAFTQVIYGVLWIGYFPAWELFIVYNPIFHLSTFILGVVGGIWYLRQGTKEATDWRANLLLLVTAAVLSGAYIILSSTFLALPHNLQPMAGLLAPLFVLLIVTLARDTSALSKLFSHRWLVTLGETAFALYILHVPVIWIYDRMVLGTSIANPDFILDVTRVPLMIVVGLIACLYIDPPIRAWLKQIVELINIPVFVTDVLLFVASVYLAFHLRFGSGREYASYKLAIAGIFWSALVLRTALTIGLKSADHQILLGPWQPLMRRLAVSTASGSVLVAAMAYLGFARGSIENFPRSVFLLDFAIVFLSGLATRAFARQLMRARVVAAAIPKST